MKLFPPSSPISYGYSDYKISRFTVSILIYKYFNNSDSEQSKSALEALKLDYQEALNLLHYFLNKPSPFDLRLLTSITKNLIDAKELITVDETAIKDGLEFLARHQEADGSFKYTRFYDHRRDIGADKFQKHILTAHVVSTFLKDDSIKSQYQLEVEKSLEFLNGSQDEFKNDYEKSIVAYVMAMDGNAEDSRNLVSSITGNYKTFTNRPKHFSMYVEIASYLAMTKILNGDDPQEEVDWLLSKRNENGRFYSAYDTVLAMQALFEAGQLEIDDFVNGSELEVKSEPSGFTVDTEVHKTEENLTVVTVIVRINWKDVQFTNLIVIEVQLPTGYDYVAHEKVKHIRVSIQL